MTKNRKSNKKSTKKNNHKNMSATSPGKFQIWLSQDTVRICLLAFGVPFLIMCIAFQSLGIYPFGDQQILVYDAWHQYYPFMAELHRKIRSGESLLYSWRMGLGSGFLPVIAYYLASPLNLLLILVPQSILREVFTLFVLVKIGLSGAFCSYVLCKTGKRKDYAVVIFSTLYALCSWMTGYYWNIMWLDTFAVFPLVALGIEKLVKEKKYRLYTISLAIAIVANYYIGLMVCIFTALYFFTWCVIQKSGIRDLLSDLGRIIGYSILSITMSSIVLIPSVISLQSTYKNDNGPTSLEVTRGWIETLENTFAYVEPTYYGGLPNLYCGVLCVIFLFVFYRVSRITVREKIVYTVLLLFLFISTNINVLNFAWHGFHVPNSLPDRFTFILSFLMVILAYRAYDGMEDLKKTDFILIAIGSLLYYLVIFIDKMNRYAIANDYDSFLDTYLFDEVDFMPFLGKNFLLIAAYLVILFLFVWKLLSKKMAAVMFAVVVALELVPTVVTGTEAVQSTDRASYPDKYAEVQKLLENLDQTDSEKFYRTEFTSDFTLNTALLYDFNGVSAFTSTANVAITDILENLGISAWQAGIRFYYQNSTPVNNMFLNLKYLISRGSEVVNKEYLSRISKIHDVSLYENQAYLPAGFMVQNEMKDFKFEGETAFDKQNNLLRAATGIEGNVFENLDFVSTDHMNLNVPEVSPGFYYYEPTEDADPSIAGMCRFNFEMPEDGCAYVYMDLGDADEVTVQSYSETTTYNIGRANIFPAGTYKKGDIFTVSAAVPASTTGNVTIYAAVFKQDVFDKAYEILNDETMKITSCRSGQMTGEITAKQDGLLYTSLPYEAGWNVYVDGKKADMELIDNAFMSVNLSEGNHKVEFKYRPVHVYLAIFLSAGSIVVFILICLWNNKKSRIA